jgi:hypothetical protein
MIFKMLFGLSAANISLPEYLAIQPLFLPLGESLKKPTLFESMSDILELEEEGSGGGGGTHSSSHQTHHPPQPPNNGGGGSSSKLQGGCGGQSSDATTGENCNQKAVSNNKCDDQQLEYLHHNCNPRQIKNVNAMSIETDV